MNQFGQFGKILVIAGLMLAGIGVLLMLTGDGKFPGHLPGDIYIRRKNFTLYLPLMTSLVLSILLILILRLFLRK